MFALILLSAIASTPNAINVGTRDPVALAILAPSGDKGKASMSAMIDAVAQTLRAHTDLSISVFDASIVTDCAGNLGCVVARVDRAAPYVILVSVLTEEGAADRLSIVVLDAVLAREVPSERVYQQALLLERVEQGITREEHAIAFLRESIDIELRPSLKRARRWDPFSTITLAGDTSGAAIVFDGRLVGVSNGGETILEDVKLGAHTLQLEHPEKQSYKTELEVASAPMRIEVALRARPATFAGTARVLTVAGGAAFAIAGGALTALAIHKSSTDAARVCFRGANAACEQGREAVRSGFDEDQAPSFDRELNRGFALAPLGLALFTAGATWIAGTLLFEAEERVPWITLLAGAALGGGAYVAVASF